MILTARERRLVDRAAKAWLYKGATISDEVARLITKDVSENVRGKDSANGPVYFTREDIVRHIGLKTNVSPVTKRTFDAKMRKLAKEREQT